MKMVTAINHVLEKLIVNNEHIMTQTASGQRPRADQNCGPVSAGDPPYRTLL